MVSMTARASVLQEPVPNPDDADRAGSVPSLCFLDRGTCCVLRKNIYQQRNEGFRLPGLENKETICP